MNALKRFFAASLAAVMMLQGTNVFVHGEETAETEKQLTVEQISASDVRMSSEYWDNYRVGTDATDDIYITKYSNNAGQYSTSYLSYAFDNDWITHWETGNGNTLNYVDVEFNKAAKIDRIIYATRQASAKGKGYPENLTIYSYNSSSGEWEKAAAGSSVATGNYVIITLPEAVSFEKLRFEFTKAYNGWASASEFVFLRSEDTVISGDVSVSGSALTGETLTAKTNITNGDSENLKYKWQYSDDRVNFYDIEGAESAEYTITEKKNYYRVIVSDKSGAYGGRLISKEKEYVKAILTGSPQVGSALKATISGIKKNYPCVWQLSESENGEYLGIEGAVGSSYTLTENEVNKYVRSVFTIASTGEKIASEPQLICQSGTYPEYTEDFVNLSDLPQSYLISNSVGTALKYNENMSGSMISVLIDGKVTSFSKGLCANANATLVYDVSFFVEKYQFERLTAWLGLDTSKGSNGDGVKFYVYTSKDNDTWTTVKTTGVLKGDTNGEYLDIDLKGVKYVKFVINRNGNNMYDHAVIAGGKLSKADYTEGNVDFIKTVGEYDKELKAYGSDFDALINNREYRKVLYQRSFVNNVSYDVLQAIAHESEKNRKALEWFMNDFEALDNYINGGPIVKGTSYARSVYALIDLYDAYSKDMSNSLYKRMLIALALVNSEKITSWTDTTQISDPVRRYGIYKRLYENGYLVNNVFENINVSEMKWVVNNRIADEEIEWFNYYLRKNFYKNVEAGEDIINSDNMPNPYNYITYGGGYNYNEEQYYSEENKAKWQEKYHLVNTDETDDDKFDINVTYEAGHPRLWIVFEEGAVCGGISSTGSHILTAFGIPSTLVGQPGHAAYFRYRYDPSDNGQYKLGIWEIWNNVSGWAKTSAAGNLLTGWGTESWCSDYPGNYLPLTQVALNDYDNYKKAEDLVKIASIYNSDMEKAEMLCEKALSYQSYNVDAWEKLIEIYVAAGKSEGEFLNLAQRVTNDMTYYPHPMRDIVINLIMPNITTNTLKADAEHYLNAALNKATKATAENVLQPDPCKISANYLLGTGNYELATFSFSGENANKIILGEGSKDSGNEMLYSLDGGVEWKNAGMVNEYLLTAGEINSITAEKDLLIKLQGSSTYHTIDITGGTQPTGLYTNDNENRVININDKLEWSEDKVNWHQFGNERFTGNRTINVRTCANDKVMASEPVICTFTTDTSTDERSYITNDRISVSGYSTAQGKETPDKTIDGNINTMWHTNYTANSDSERYVAYKFNRPIFLSAVEYTPRQSGGNGRFTSCEVYTSVNGTEWTLSATASGWANNGSKKAVVLNEPTYAGYVKVVGKTAIGNFGSAAMMEFYEDVTFGKTAMDVNNDGSIDRVDAAMLMRFVSGMSVSSEFDESKADINRDGEFSIIDVIGLQSYIADNAEI